MDLAKERFRGEKAAGMTGKPVKFVSLEQKWSTFQGEIQVEANHVESCRI